MADIFPPDGQTTLGQVRYLIQDYTQHDYDRDGELRYRISDDALNAHIALSGDRPYLAGATALRALAANEVLISKVIQTEDLRTDGAKVADALRMLADDLEERQKQEDDEEAYSEAFDIVPSPYPYHNWER